MVTSPSWTFPTLLNRNTTLKPFIILRHIIALIILPNDCMYLFYYKMYQIENKGNITKWEEEKNSNNNNKTKKKHRKFLAPNFFFYLLALNEYIIFVCEALSDALSRWWWSRAILSISLFSKSKRLAGWLAGVEWSKKKQ